MLVVIAPDVAIWDASARIRNESGFSLSLSLSRELQSVVEKVTYRSVPDQPGKTIATRSAWIDSSVFGFSTAIRAFGLDRFKKNCLKTVNGFNYVLQNMFPATHAAAMVHNQQQQHQTKAQKIKEAAKHASEQVKAQAEQLVQNLSVKG